MSQSAAKQIAALAMTQETPEHRAERAAKLRKQADAAEAKSMQEDDAGHGEEAIELRATAHRQRNLAALVDPKKAKKKPSRGGG